jgi:hypothetical protein
VLYAITGTMTASKLSPAYWLGLFFTAMAMLVLPLIYIGLTVAVGYGVWWHVFSHAWLLSRNVRQFSLVRWPLVSVTTTVWPSFSTCRSFSKEVATFWADAGLGASVTNTAKVPRPAALD